MYGDSFSIWNDGSLPEGITEEDLKKIHRSKPRNPLIADVCFRGGYIDSWGRGTIKIIEACKDAELPEPVLKEEQGGFLSKILKERFTEDQLKKLGLNERQIDAVEYVKRNGKITNSDFQKLCKVSERTALRDLDELNEKNVFRKKGEKKGTYYELNNGGYMAVI